MGMTDPSRRKALRAQYEQTRPEAAVYRIVNNQNGRILLGSTPNLASVRNKLEFAKATSVYSVLGPRLTKDVAAFGIEAFSLDVLEVLETTPEMTPAQVLADLATLEELWREQLDPALLY